MAVRKFIVRLGGAFVACVLAGCATADSAASTASAPPVHEDPAARQAFIAKMQLRFPSSTYLVGFGVGSTATEAEDNAKVRAAENISSEIQANLRSLQTEATTGGRTTNGTAVSQEIVQKVTTDAGAFIHSHPELTTLIGGSYEAVAVASREELDGKYARDSEQLLSKLLIAWDVALKQQGGPIQSITSALCESRRYESKLDAIDGERWLVAGRGVWTDEAKARRKQIQQLRERLRSTRVSIVRTPELPGVDEEISKAVATAGFPVDLVGKPDCAAGGLIVAVAKQQSCRMNEIAMCQQCDVVLTATANRCNANDALFSESSNQAVGMNATDEAAAVRDAMKKLKMSSFVQAVSKDVSHIIEGECAK